MWAYCGAAGTICPSAAVLGNNFLGQLRQVVIHRRWRPLPLKGFPPKSRKLRQFGNCALWDYLVDSRL
jgi:hypothetical protein